MPASGSKACSEQQPAAVPYPAITPINLTEAADRLPWHEAEQRLRLHAQNGNATLDIRPIGQSGEPPADPGLSDIVYVVIVGYGLLHCAETTLEFTTGDVLFLPRGHPHRIEGLNGEIRLWRIALDSPPEPPEQAGPGTQAGTAPA
jgi:mannose-6-phosphate isomerase-like protein (cupin superfamily)